MADVTALCNRVVVIDMGRIIYDGNLRTMAEQLAPYKVLKLILRKPLSCEALAPYGQVAACNGVKATLRVPREKATDAAARLLTAVDMEDVTIEEPPIEEIVAEMFNRGQARANPPQHGERRNDP